jgi:predicted ATPase
MAAQVLEQGFPDTVATQPALLAQHYTKAGLYRQAAAYWHRAGKGAIQHCAHVEARAHLTTGLELLTTLPPAPERHQQELALYLALGSAQALRIAAQQPLTGSRGIVRSGTGFATQASPSVKVASRRESRRPGRKSPGRLPSQRVTGVWARG